jgi:hypothetical protein
MQLIRKFKIEVKGLMLGFILKYRSLSSNGEGEGCACGDRRRVRPGFII